MSYSTKFVYAMMKVMFNVLSFYLPFYFMFCLNSFKKVTKNQLDIINQCICEIWPFLFDPFLVVLGNVIMCYLALLLDFSVGVCLRLVSSWSTVFHWSVYE